MLSCHLPLHYHRWDLIVLQCHRIQPGRKLMKLQNEQIVMWKVRSWFSKNDGVVLHFFDSWINMKNTHLVPFQVCICLTVSAELLLNWFSLWSVRNIHSPFGYPVYISEQQGLLTVRKKGYLCGLIFCVITICDWLFPKWHVIFQHRLFFQRITILGFAERDAHLLKCEFEFLEKKHQIFILIY